jgi:hypothetical protein
MDTGAAMDVEAGADAACARIKLRSGRLRRGLQSMGVAPGQRIVVLCCGDHAEDRQVAVDALKGLGVVAITPSDWTRPALDGLFDNRIYPNIHLACEEGVAAWRAVRGTGIMIADGPGVVWWRALECRHAADTVEFVKS